MQFFFEFSNSNFISFFQLCNSDFNLFNFVIVIFIILLLLVGCGKGIAFWKEKHDFIHISSTNSIGRKLNDTDSLSQTYQHNNWLLDCASAVFSVCKLQLILRAGATLLSNWRLASATSYSTLGSLHCTVKLQEHCFPGFPLSYCTSVLWDHHKPKTTVLHKLATLVPQPDQEPTPLCIYRVLGFLQQPVRYAWSQLLTCTRSTQGT